ncbi:hypothetical protein Hanom_Chr06g00479551 [Helianthus anomalus]
MRPCPLIRGNRMESVNPRSPSDSNPGLKPQFLPFPKCLSKMIQAGIEPASPLRRADTNISRQKS